MYDYDRRIKLAALEPTVEGFVSILRGLLIQYDTKQSRTRFYNPYALGQYMGAVDRVRQMVSSVLRSAAPEDLEKLRKAVDRNFNDFPPKKAFFKALDNYISTGKAPKYPVARKR